MHARNVQLHWTGVKNNGHCISQVGL
jgi:hypothetical protein